MEIVGTDLDFAADASSSVSAHGAAASSSSSGAHYQTHAEAYQTGVNHYPPAAPNFQPAADPYQTVATSQYGTDARAAQSNTSTTATSSSAAVAAILKTEPSSSSAAISVASAVSSSTAPPPKPSYASSKRPPVVKRVRQPSGGGAKSSSRAAPSSSSAKALADGVSIALADIKASSPLARVVRPGTIPEAALKKTFTRGPGPVALPPGKNAVQVHNVHIAQCDRRAPRRPASSSSRRFIHAPFITFFFFFPRLGSF